MDENQPNKNVIQNKDNNYENNEILDINNQKIDIEILNKIFQKSKIDNSKYIPILLKESENEILKIFTDYPNIINESSIEEFILQKLKLISQIIFIINPSPEILYIISNYLFHKNTSIFIYIIELYFSYITLNQNKIINKSIINEIKKIFSYLILCGLLTKKDVDYIYQKIAFLQLEKKLTIKLFSYIIPLLQMVYGGESGTNIKPNLIPKNFIYFYDKKSSIIQTNISENKFIQIKNGFTVILWFCLKETNEDDGYKSSLLYLKNEKGYKINVILNDKNDIDILYNDDVYLKEKENKKFDIKKNIWTQLRICINKDEINFYLLQNNYINNKYSIEEYSRKNYINEVIKTYSFYECKITEISFYKNFIGNIGTILFFIDSDIHKKISNEFINNLFQIKKKNANDILFDNKTFKSLCFVFSPYLYINNQTIIDRKYNIVAKLPEIDNKTFNLNSIFCFHNYTKNIFYLGGFNNFLPLFEIFYKFTLNEDNTKEINNELINIFNKLFQLLEVVFFKDKNCKIPLEKDIHFFEILQVFMEKIDEKYYYNNKELLIILLVIGKKYNELKRSKLIKIQENSGFFISIIFNPDIMIKFNLQLQKKFFEEIKFFLILFPFKKINKFLLLLSQKYTNNEIEKDEYSQTLFNYIKKIFENIKLRDSERESLFLLYKNKNNNIANNLILTDNIFIHIIRLFIIYLDIKINSFDLDEEKKEQRKQTVNYLLNSENHFIENLLKYLSETNVHVKNVIINFLRVLTQIYGDLLEQYFLKMNKKKKNERINKEEFYIFIKENIAPNYYNRKIEENEFAIINKNRKDSIFYLEVENESNNINDNSENKNVIITDEKKQNKDIKSKIIHKRYKSYDDKSPEILKDDLIILQDKPLKLRNKSFNKNNNFVKKYQLNKKKEDVKNINQEPQENKKEEKENQIIIEKDELSLEQKIEIHEANAEIALLLYNWLFSLVENKEKNNIDIKEESIHHLIDYIVKFISYTKDLSVIFRILLLLGSPKASNENKNSDDNDKKIYKSLLFYLSGNSLFLQILIELLIHSYIYKNLYSNNPKEEDNFIAVTKKENDTIKLKLNNFRLIYDKGIEILLDIYFHENNTNKAEILRKIFLISLKLLLHFQDTNDIQKKNLLLKFVKQIFIDINETYNIKHEIIKKFYLDFFTFFMDYCFILKNVDEHLQGIYKDIKEDRTNCLPDFLIHGLIFETEVEYQWAGNDIYNSIFNNLKKLFFIKNIFNKLEIVYKDVNNQKEKQDNIFCFDINWVKSLINEVISKKKKDGNPDYKNIKALFYSYKDGGYSNNFPIMNIISLFMSLNLYLLYSETNTFTNQGKLLSLIKEIQNYIIFLIITSFILNPNDYVEYAEEFDDKQILIYKNLFFNIQNILNRLKDQQNKKYYLQVLYNIILFLSVIFDIEQNEKQKKKNKNFLKNMFNFSNIIEVSKTAPSLLIDFYMKNNDSIFNEKNFSIFIEGNKEKGMKLLEDSISFEKIKNMNDNKDINPSFDLFNIKIFQDVVFKRENLTNEKLRLLIGKKNESNTDINNYRKIYLKVKRIQNNFYFDEVKQQQQEISKIKSYRKIKKDLYSYDNSYSNLQVFYNISSGQNNKTNYLLKYKVCNFLNKDMSRKIIKPIIDTNNYMPNFRRYDYIKKQIYQHSIDEVYNVDLQIFKPEEKGFLFPDPKKNIFYKYEYYLEENVCYIKTTNHVKGVIYHLNDIENLNENYFYFCIVEQPDKQEKIKSYEDFDSLNDSCFSSIFRNNINKKDKNTYLKINFNEINFIFCRKYCYKDNSLEVFTSSHRSYYFKFKNQEKRNKFLEHILSILNKDSSLFKKLFKPIHSINEYGKKIILGYYKDIENNYEYSNINNIKELWKNSKISCFEYLMWINIFGNRSFRDMSQYPVFPWIITDYKTDTFEEIINNKTIRNFKLPMGLLSLDEKGKERQEGYINSYKYMCLELDDDDIIDLKIKEDDENNNEEQNDKPDNSIEDKIKDNTLPKIPQYGFNIEKLYKDLSVEYEKIPYLFGSHYNNAMYISHYMGRLFPYSLTMIEIQGAGFDCAERLFICLQKTFSSAASEKCDVRELIPEFYSMPEFFMNINKLNFGEICTNNYLDAITYYDELFEQNGKKQKIPIEDVLFPKWSKDNAYIFILKSKELLENNNLIDLNPWIDLIFGYTQRGRPAQQVGNLFLPCSYDGVINSRVKDEDLLKNRNDLEYKMRLFELGVNPTKVFDKKLWEKKKINYKQISDIEGDIKNDFYSISENDIHFVANINSNNLMFICGRDYQIKKISIEEKIELKNGYKVKEVGYYNFSKEILEIDKYYKLYIKIFVKYNIILFAGFYSGNAYLYSLDKSHNLKLISKNKNNDKIILNYFKEGFITSLEVSQDEKYIISGNNKGTLVILELLYNNNIFSNDENNIKLIKKISSHSGYGINYISINSDMNLFGDCSYDNFIHIYTLPKCDKIVSIYYKENTFYPDFIFLSAQPLASIILYSNQTTKFKSYSINGKDLNIEQNDINLLNESKYKNKNICENMISPFLFTNSQFNDYLIYIFRYQYIILRKAPLMDLVFKINFNENEYISMINLSLTKESIYAADYNSKKVYIINYDKCKPISKDDNNQENVIENSNNNNIEIK